MRLILAFVLTVFTVSAFANCIPERDKNGRIKRSSYQVVLFKRANPCPSTGLNTGKCPGWVVDHKTPLCLCGSDSPENMAWQKLAESKIKDAYERKLCGGD